MYGKLRRYACHPDDLGQIVSHTVVLFGSFREYELVVTVGVRLDSL